MKPTHACVVSAISRMRCTDTVFGLTKLDHVPDQDSNKFLQTPLVNSVKHSDTPVVDLRRPQKTAPHDIPSAMLRGHFLQYSMSVMAGASGVAARNHHNFIIAVLDAWRLDNLARNSQSTRFDLHVGIFHEVRIGIVERL